MADPQHPDIAMPTLEQMPALIAKHDEFAALAAEHGHDEMAALHAVTAAALRFLTRPVEDEEVRTADLFLAWVGRAFAFGAQDSSKLYQVRDLLARLAREKASALRAARAAAIEDAARVAEVSAGRLKRTASEDTTADDEEAAAYLYGASVAENIAAAIRSLGEEIAAPREEERAG